MTILSNSNWLRWITYQQKPADRSKKRWTKNQNKWQNSAYLFGWYSIMITLHAYIGHLMISTHTVYIVMHMGNNDGSQWTLHFKIIIAIYLTWTNRPSLRNLIFCYLVLVCVFFSVTFGVCCNHITCYN